MGVSIKKKQKEMYHGTLSQPVICTTCYKTSWLIIGNFIRKCELEIICPDKENLKIIEVGKIVNLFILIVFIQVLNWLEGSPDNFFENKYITFA